MKQHDVTELSYTPLAALTWFFFPGGDTTPASDNFVGISPALATTFDQFNQVISKQADFPKTQAAIEAIRSQIGALIALNGALGSIWGYAGIVTPDKVVQIAKLDDASLLRALMKRDGLRPHDATPLGYPPLAALMWFFFPGGDTTPANDNFVGISDALASTFDQFTQVISMQPNFPETQAAIESIRSQIGALIALNGALGSIWGYSGIITTDKVVQISNLASASLLRADRTPALSYTPLAALLWFFFPGGDTTPASDSFVGISAALGATFDQFSQVISKQPDFPETQAAIEAIRRKIAVLIAQKGPLGHIWGYSGIVTKDKVVQIAKLDDPSLLRTLIEKERDL